MLNAPTHLAEQFSGVTAKRGDKTVIRGDSVAEFIDACREDGLAVAACEGFRRHDQGFSAQMELIADFRPNESSLESANSWSQVIDAYARNAKADLARRLKMFDDIESLYFEFYFKTQEEAEAED